MSRILVVTAGRGPAEVRQFVDALGPALAACLLSRGNVVEDVVLRSGSAQIWFTGDAPLDDLVGTHVLVDPLRGARTRRRWFAGVSVHTVAVPVVNLDPRDVVITASRAGGPGGQHVNTTASAVRATHAPTGLSVRVCTERSQHANRRVALRRLASRLAGIADQAEASGRQAAWHSHDTVIRGNPVATWRPEGGGIACVKISSKS